MTQDQRPPGDAEPTPGGAGNEAAALRLAATLIQQARLALMQPGRSPKHHRQHEQVLEGLLALAEQLEDVRDMLGKSRGG